MYVVDVYIASHISISLNLLYAYYLFAMSKNVEEFLLMILFSSLLFSQSSLLFSSLIAIFFSIARHMDATKNNDLITLLSSDASENQKKKLLMDIALQEKGILFYSILLYSLMLY